MRDKFLARFLAWHSWQVVLLSMLGAVLITDLITAVVSVMVWGEVRLDLLVLGTVNAMLVPAIMLPVIIRALRKMLRLEEQNQRHQETIQHLEKSQQFDIETRQRAKEMSFLYHLGVLLASGRNLNDTLQALRSEIVKLIEADAFYVAMYDAETDVVRYPIYLDDTSDGDPHNEFSRSLLKNPGMAGAVIFSGKTLYLPDMFDSNVIREYNPVNEKGLRLHTFVGVPLVSNGQVIGMISVQSKQIDAYTPDQIQLMENVAIQAAVAIEKADLVDQLQQELAVRKRVEDALHQSAVRLEIIHEIDRALLSANSLDEIKLNALTRVRELVPCERTSITVFNFEQKNAFFLAANFEDQNRTTIRDTFPLETYGLYIIDELKKSKPYFVNDVLDEPRATDLDKTLAMAGYRTWLYLPLLYQGRLIGALNLARGAGFPFQVQDAENLSDIVNELAIAIQQMHLYDSLQMELEARKQIEASLRERETILETITFAAEQFLKTPDWRININLVLEHLGRTIHATHAYLFEHYVSTDGVEYSSLKYEWTAPGCISDFDNPYYQQPHPLGIDEGSTDYLLRQGIIFVGNVSNFPASEKERLQAMGVKAMVELPVFVDEKWWGTFGFDDLETEREWSSAEVDALRIAVEILGAAIQRQKTEAAVRESERIYRQAIEAAGAVPYYRDYREGNYSFMGSEIERIIGYKPEEVTMALWQDIMKENIPLGEGAGIEIDDAVQRSRTGSIRIWHSDMRVIARNGEEKWLTDSAVELFDDSAFSYASVGILQDVTDRKRTETILRKRESILDATTFAAEQFLKTPDWRETINTVLKRLGLEFNASHAYLFEKHRDVDGVMLNSLRYEWAAPGQKSDLDNPEYQNAPVPESDFRHYYAILDSGEPFVGSTSYFMESEDEKKWMEDTGIKALLEMRIVVDGKQWGTIGFDDMVNERVWTPMEVDVIRVAANVLGAAIKRQLDEAALQVELDERKKLIEELEVRNAESETLRETTVIVTSTLDIKEAVKRILEQLKRVVLYDSASVWLYEGKTARLIGDDGLPEIMNKAKSYVLNDQEPDYPLWKQEVPYILLYDIQEAYFQFRIPPMDYIHGWLTIPLKVRGMMIGFISLDGRQPGQFNARDAELALNFANQVSIALENARLFSELQAKFDEHQKLIGELENKNSELERFTYTVSHDLKSPLVTINGFLGYLEQDALAGNVDRMKRDLQRIQEAVKKMQNLLNELLELSRIGRVMNLPEAVAFNDLVREALYVVHGRLEERKVRVFVQPAMVVVQVDKPRIIEVLQNLLDNAAKYMGDQIDPYIEVGQHIGQNGLPVFYVKDNGMGIAPEFHERVFGLFNKLDPRSEGTGVGLALVKRIIEVHHGSIWVESEEGNGSVFLFTLPVSNELQFGE